MSVSSPTGSTLPEPTVLIIDDHDLVATALAMSLRSVGLQTRRYAVRSRADVVLAAATVPPGILLLDLDLGREPDGTVIDGATMVGRFCTTGWQVLVLTGTSDHARIGKALAAGAVAAIPKSAPLPVLVTTIRRVARGVDVMPPQRREQYIDAHRRQLAQEQELLERLAKLSDRERTVLDRLARGVRAQAIAEEFVVSIATVRTQIRSVLAKLGVGSQLEAVALMNDYRRTTQNGSS